MMSRRVLYVIVGLVAAALYGNTLANPFWETDAHLYHLLSQRALVDLSPAALDEIYGFVLHSPKGWADVGSFATWLGLFSLAGPWVVPYHVTVVTLHLLCALLLMEAVLAAGRSRKQALATALLFTATPLVEEIATVPAKLEYALFVAFALSARLAFQRWCERGGARWLAGASIASCAAALTKEFAVVLPLLALLAARTGGKGERAPFARHRLMGVALIAMLVLPTFVRPVVLSLAPAAATTATAPADMEMGDDLADYLTPGHLLPKMLADLTRFGLVPFSGEGTYARWFPLHVALMATALLIGLLGRVGEGPPDRRLLLEALAWIVVGYGLVGFHISRDSFEKTGELYAATVGISILGGELLAGGRAIGRARAVALVAVLTAMAVHTLSLHRLSRVHGERVATATATLEQIIEELEPGGSIVILGEGHLDRGAVDAVVLAVALGRDEPLPYIHLVNGVRKAELRTACPPGGVDVTEAGSRVLRWHEERHVLTELGGIADRAEALEWPNPDPEENHVGIACARIEGGWRVAEADVIRNLSPDTILPRL